MPATFYVGDAIEVMNSLPEKSVDLILTSPPFLALRSYLPADHPDKTLEGGSQATPGEYVDWLLDVVEACARVLAPHGSLVFELGDTYSASGGAGGDYGENGQREGQPRFRQAKASADTNAAYAREKPKGDGVVAIASGTGWPLAKSLSLIPETFRFAMVYGVNPHTGRQTAPWRLRNVVRWVRPNPPVGALGDKFRPATSELMVFCKAKDRFFDLDAVREPYSREQIRAPLHTFKDAGNLDNNKGRVKGGLGEFRSIDSAGAPPLDWWNIPLLEGEEEGQVWWCETHGAQRSITRLDRCWFDEHYTYDGDPCRMVKASLRVQQESAPAWNVPLLEGEEETRYGPKDERKIGGQTTAKGKPTGSRNDDDLPHMTAFHPLGTPPLDWWNIPPGGYPGAHYAVWPPELCVKPIKAMCPEKVCRTCGEPQRRITGDVEYVDPDTGRPAHLKPDTWRGGRNSLGFSVNQSGGSGYRQAAVRQAPTTGFSDCGHDNWRPGLVLDCFAGSGTTLAVATGHGRDAIGIDLDERNYELALDRVGPFILTRGEIPSDEIH